MHKVIHERAKAIGKASTSVLLDNADSGNDASEASEAFKLSYLILRKPNRFLKRFGKTEALYIDATAVANFLSENGYSLPGPPHLIENESYIIRQHNKEVKSLLQTKGSIALA